MDSTQKTLADFMDLPDLDIMERAVVFNEYMEDIKANHHLQYRRVSMSGSRPIMEVMDPYSGNVEEMIYLASNDYLNLTKHPRTIEAGKQALEKYGTGAGSVPLLGGTLDIHIELEKKIARFKGCQNAILYTSGFGSNVGTLLAMLDEKDVAILDLLDHASIIDGCQRANVEYFRHNNIDSLEKVLKKVQHQYRTKLIAVDGVYSMDGDIAPLDQIVALAKQYGAYVMVDEAHATGVIGKNGRGTPEYFNLEGKVDIVAGTFSKGLGCVGGFIAASDELVELLHYYSRAYMFSTAPTPQVAGSLIAGIDIIETEPELRQKLWDNIHYFRKQLLDLGFNLGRSETAIFPIIIGDDLKVKEMCRMLHERGVYVNPVLYPAVPKRLARVRMSLMSAHTKCQLDYVLDSLESIGKKLGIIKSISDKKVKAV